MISIQQYLKSLDLLVLLLFNLISNGYSQSVQDSLYIEAESGYVEAPMKIFDDPEASNCQYVTVETGNESTGSPPATGKVSLEVNLNAGNYKVWGRVITPSGSEDSFWVQVDDGNIYRWNAIGEYSSWTWAAVHDSYDNAQELEWQLEEGLHTITFYYREEGAQLDEVYITRFDDQPTKGDVVVNRTIYVSQELGDDNSDGSESNPIRTLFKAYQIARATQDEVTNYEILLRGGETYDDFQPIYGLEEGRGPVYFGFVWDINKKLKMSTYGPNEKAHLLGSKHKHEGGPTQGLLVIDPSTEDVLIENLFFEKWQEGALMTFETEDVHIRNIKIDKVGTYYFPKEETPRSSELYPYTAGVIYPKNSTRILMEFIEMTNCHNVFEDVSNLHGFYGTRLNESEIRHCYLRNVSGSPFKFRRSQANNVYIHNNEAYYTGHTEFEESWAQPGFLRYSGDPGGDCPFALTLENNVFHYPFCWSEYGEDCETTETVLCSVSNTTSCGEGACTDSENVYWINNDIIFSWREGQQFELPIAPFGLFGDSKTENSVTIGWFDTNVNENTFIIERLTDGQFVEVARLGPNSTDFTEQNLQSSTVYNYRIFVENSIGRSVYSETLEISTRSPNNAPVPVILTSDTIGLAPFEVVFDGRQSGDPDGDDFLYTWLIDGDFAGNRDTMTYTFDKSGIFKIELILNDGISKGRESVDIEVLEPLSRESAEEAIVVYPNPSNGYFYISSNQQGVELSIYDLSGRLVKRFGTIKNEKKSYFLPSGIYMMVFRYNEEQIIKRRLLIY